MRKYQKSICALSEGSQFIVIIVHQPYAVQSFVSGFVVCDMRVEDEKESLERLFFSINVHLVMIRIN